MLNSSDVKDKNIRELVPGTFFARVEYYNGKIVDCGQHDTIKRAQKELDRFPRDVWDGYATNEQGYREPDDKSRRPNRPTKARRPKQSGLSGFGRYLAGGTVGPTGSKQKQDS